MENSAAEQTPVSILGATGDLGFGLALRLSHEGVPIVIGSRSPERAAAAAERALEHVPHARIEGMTNDQAIERAEVIVLSVPFASHADTLKGLAESFREGQVLVDATVPLATALGGRPTATIGVWHGSAAQQAKALVPEGVRVVSGLHTVSAATLTDLGHALHEDVLICGDRREDKRRVADIIERVPGLRVIDCGRLELSRFTEQLTPLLISINGRYKTHAGIHIVGIPAEA
ncbi:MAG: NADPH-dependent F420 reductase [Solirubrobacteraceae bacterium]